jgi:hypothetical protein
MSRPNARARTRRGGLVRFGPDEIKAEQPERGEEARPSGQKLRREKISFSFFISNFSNAFSNKDLNRI